MYENRIISPSFWRQICNGYNFKISYSKNGNIRVNKHDSVNRNYLRYNVVCTDYANYIVNVTSNGKKFKSNNLLRR